MLSQSNVMKILTVAALAVAGVTAQAGDNPRHPSWFWGKAHANVSISVGDRYIDARNPRDPNFYAKGAWQAAAASEAYADRGNPLHPKYQKF